MSRIEHHPNEDTLLSYAAGSLPAALALVVGCHIQFCPHCRSQVRAGESLGGELMSALTPKALSMRARDNMLARLALQESQSEVPAAVGSLTTAEATSAQDAMPSLLRNILKESDFDELPWKKTIAPGLKQIVLDCGEGQARLLRIAAGQKMPVHSHRGSELTLILRGGYSDKLGQFNAGDVADLDGSVEHQPVADDDMDCICLAGMDAPLVFKGWLAKLIQPFVGM
ncbi:ChrR family anti-sigma-E factor [Zhongshania aliphaticivorans]|uniref:ChrR family anti-sigma-E factor n=1 Tax=Zhongshania aliphaticivorans TaxID=1470434 RepID=UPI0012E44F5E|nr:ChrR family anti-sigma-E factor [Zhongshania aliphaticivorans]CAA0100179.1 Anti-sigma-E factor ChrR [Zhongshania aliphaticivorans]